jgi:TolB protein
MQKHILVRMEKLIFQAHDGDSLCDQIYIIDISSGSAKMVSTGNGVTTCSFFQYPDDDGIIYASIHMADSDCPPKPDFSMGYIWKLYPGFDIFYASKNGNNLKRLTDASGYDAEAVYPFDGIPMFSKDGKYLVFASNRNQKKRGDTNIFICEWVE